MDTYQSKLTLKDRITAILVAAGFPNSLDTEHSHGPAFVVTAGVGATVGIMWWNASDHMRELLLTQYEAPLRAAGLPVVNRGNILYVAEPTTAIFLPGLRERFIQIITEDDEDTRGDMSVADLADALIEEIGGTQPTEPPAAMWVRQAQHVLAYIQGDCAVTDLKEQLLILAANLDRAAKVLADPLADERSTNGLR
jgi:hypothetical protein